MTVWTSARMVAVTGNVLGQAAGSPWTAAGIACAMVLLVVGGGWSAGKRRLAAVVGSVAVLLTVAACAGQQVRSPAAAPDGTRRVELTRGQVQRYAVPVGSTVELVVSSDVADEVHLHGYDRSSFVTAGATTTLRFVADVPGVFDVELERTGEQLGQLAVS